MLSVEETATCRAPAEEVWVLLYDPERFREWWEATEGSEAGAGGETPDRGDDGMVALPTHIERVVERSQVVVSCQVADVVWKWTLAPWEQGCRVMLRMELADHEAHRFDAARDVMLTSIRRLVAAAERVGAQRGD